MQVLKDLFFPAIGYEFAVLQKNRPVQILTIIRDRGAEGSKCCFGI
ncbi:hypothetical protein QUA45_23915 [Microcoleus sp. Pol12A5]